MRTVRPRLVPPQARALRAPASHGDPLAPYRQGPREDGELALIEETAAVLAAAADEPAVGRALAVGLARLLPRARVSVWRAGRAPETALSLVAAVPPLDGVGARPVPMDEDSLAQRAFACGGVVLARHGGSALERRLRTQPGALLWTVPLMADGRRLGVAYVTRPRAPRDPARVGRLMGILGAQAALAVRLLQDRRGAEREAMQLLATAAHDLKNTATSIKGYAQLIWRQVPPDTAPAIHRYAGIIEQQVDRLAEHLAALVDLGRLQAGVLRPERTFVDLRDLVQAAVARLDPPCDGTALRLELPAVPVTGRWDGPRLQRALASVLAAVWRGTQGTEPVRVALTATDGVAELRAATSSGLFAPLTPHDWDPAADLSLHLARGIIEALGGTLGYRRTPHGEIGVLARLPCEPATGVPDDAGPSRTEA